MDPFSPGCVFGTFAGLYTEYCRLFENRRRGINGPAGWSAWDKLNSNEWLINIARVSTGEYFSAWTTVKPISYWDCMWNCSVSKISCHLNGFQGKGKKWSGVVKYVLSARRSNHIDNLFVRTFQWTSIKSFALKLFSFLSLDHFCTYSVLFWQQNSFISRHYRTFLCIKNGLLIFRKMDIDSSKFKLPINRK